MIILIRKRSLVRVFGFSVLLLCCILFQHDGSTAVFGPIKLDIAPVTIVIDPGHGGEDGGAVSVDGIKESQINLDISIRLNDLLRFTGFQTLMTRSQDISISDDGLNTIRERKASDLHNRVDLINQTENALLLSIHQNSLPTSPVTHGAQAFWNHQAEAETMAAVMQDSLNSAINTGNEKHPRKISDSIYLMNHISVPGILIECGFLSNAAETSMLQNSSYQVKLAAAITSGYLRYAAGEDLLP